MAKLVTKSKPDTPVDNEAIAGQIERELKLFPDSTAQQMMSGYVGGYLGGARSGDEQWNDALFYAGLGMVHAAVNAGKLELAERVDGGWYVTNSEGWNKRDFAEIAIPAYVCGFDQAKSIVPTSVQETIKSLYPHWFKLRYGLDYSSEREHFLLNPSPIVAPFDHFTERRSFIGGVFHYPKEYTIPTFSYMKADEYPPTIWYSDRAQNDFEGYVTNKAGNQGITIPQAIEETGSHEAAHLLAIDPAVAIAMRGNKHCWLTEAVPQYYGERAETKSIRLGEVVVPDNITLIADTDGKPVDYGVSLLLTMSIAAKLGGSIRDIPAGMEQVVKKVADRARLVADGQADRVGSPLELMYLLDPSLKEPKNKAEMVDIMRDVQEEHSCVTWRSHFLRVK